MAFTFGTMTILAGFDLALDLKERLSLKHTLIEESIFVVGLAGLFLIGTRLLRTLKRERAFKSASLSREEALRSEAAGLVERLAATEREATHWKQEAGALLEGLGVAIDAQFGRWGLTRAERGVALLLLKGLSHKEIAQIRTVSEATVRQQSQGVYRKAGVSSRNDLAAFFLEDLLLPGTGDTTELFSTERRSRG